MPIEELARILAVTPQTIRRDINQLCEDNLLRRYHGGAALGSSVENEDYFARKGKLQNEKAHIADLIASSIPDHASLFMSIGTTIEVVAQALVAPHKGLRVITNNIHVASTMSANPDFNVLITSGVVRASAVGCGTLGSGTSPRLQVSRRTAVTAVAVVVTTGWPCASG